MWPKPDNGLYYTKHHLHFDSYFWTFSLIVLVIQHKKPTEVCKVVLLRKIHYLLYDTNYWAFTFTTLL